MRIARLGASTFTAACLIFAAAALVFPTGYTVCAGEDCTTVSCGSPAFPKTLTDLGPERIDDATNGAGRTPAAAGLYGVFGAAVGLRAFALTSRRSPARADGSPGPHA